MEKLPMIPGYSSLNEDYMFKDHKVKQTCDFLNGFRIVRDPNYKLDLNTCDVDPAEYDPSMTYGEPREYLYKRFLPHYALYAQKCLSFHGFFRESVLNSPQEHYRIRKVRIFYFLENDTIMISEPSVENAGIWQRKLAGRCRIPRNADAFYHWKDLNVGIDIVIYGITYHISNCDAFTREFLTSQGIDVGENESIPKDPYMQARFDKAREEAFAKIPPNKTDDKRRRFLEYDGMILTFDATWEEGNYKVMYFLTDDTVSVCEVRKPNDGKDRSSMILKKSKLPKDWSDIPKTHPTYLEMLDSEVQSYYSPGDLLVGSTMYVFGRKFCLVDCDEFTRKYYAKMLGIIQPVLERKEEPKITPIERINEKQKPNKKTVIRKLVNFPCKLRYSVIMDSKLPEDKDRDFRMEYELDTGGIRIIEVRKPNSGRREGCFLKSTLVKKPGAGTVEDPEYYTPEDFYIGAKLHIFQRQFIITGADFFVYKYIKENPSSFDTKLQENIREYFVKCGLIESKSDVNVKEESADLSPERKSEELNSDWKNCGK